MTRLRGAARGGTDGDGRPRSSAVRGRRCPAMGWTPEAPTARGQTRDRWESLQALVDQADRVRRTPARRLGDFVDDLDRRAAEQHAPVADGVTLATLHAAKGLEWDAVFLVRRSRTAPCPITYADTPDRGRGGAPAALRRHDPRPARPRAVVGAGPQPRRPRPPASPRGSSTRCCPTRRARPSRARAKQPQGRQLPRVRQAAGHRRGEEARPLRRLPGVLRRGAVRAAARVAHGAGRPRRACRRSWSSPTPRCS